ncbi:hypothetical protein V7146_20530 [Gottfriedia acidiceleris]|uniref:hypothetical protein n=1 Tax=Gottfriedia acidiceleris TaxID=371036 RepID=UPI003000A55B
MFENLQIHTRKKLCPQEYKEYNFIIGIAPYQKAIVEHNQFEENTGSIPDGWICGKNFNLLFEFKIRGTLDEPQLIAHQKLLKGKVIQLEWKYVIEALKNVYLLNQEKPVQCFLIEQFLDVTSNFKSKRKSSGMPSQIISGKVSQDKAYFTITGSKYINRPYVVEIVLDGKKVELNNNLKGIQEARRWIANYVITNSDNLPINFIGMNTEITDLCIVPGRKKNNWNQWKLGAFINIV